VQVVEGNDFWSLINELIDDNSCFLHNRNILVEAYKSGNLYSLRVNETESMYGQKAVTDNIFCKNSFYLLPCLCVRDSENAVIIWTHKKARLNGFAKLLIQLLDIKVAKYPLEESIGFWNKLNIKTVNF